MRIIPEWQYRYIEKCLYNYHNIKTSELETERKMVVAIEEALEYFQGTSHEIMLKEFYLEHKKHRKHFTLAGHYRYVCTELIHTEEPNGYVMRREIIYRVAMVCYELGVFKTGAQKKIAEKVLEKSENM